jgi:hypothetical protein
MSNDSTKTRRNFNKPIHELDPTTVIERDIKERDHFTKLDLEIIEAKLKDLNLAKKKAKERKKKIKLLLENESDHDLKEDYKKKLKKLELRISELANKTIPDLKHLKKLIEVELK